MKRVLRHPERRSRAAEIAYAAVAAATLVGGKYVLSAIPNVEIVTLLCAVYGYVLGFTGLISVYVFVVAESFLYGFGTWVVSYFVHWPAVCATFMLLSYIKKPSRVLFTAAAVLLTFLFGVFSSLVDVGLASGNFDNFLGRFTVYYARGAYFYLAQILTNLILFPIAFVPLTKAVARVTRRPSGRYPRIRGADDLTESKNR